MDSFFKELTAERDDLQKKLSEYRSENENLKTTVNNLEKILKDLRVIIIVLYHALSILKTIRLINIIYKTVFLVFFIRSFETDSQDNLYL